MCISRIYNSQRVIHTVFSIRLYTYGLVELSGESLLYSVNDKENLELKFI